MISLEMVYRIEWFWWFKFCNLPNNGLGWLNIVFWWRKYYWSEPWLDNHYFPITAVVIYYWMVVEIYTMLFNFQWCWNSCGLKSAIMLNNMKKISKLFSNHLKWICLLLFAVAIIDWYLFISTFTILGLYFLHFMT